MKWSVRLLLALALPFSMAQAADMTFDRSNAWFKPKLVENRSALCYSLLGEANRLFNSSATQLDDAAIVIGGMTPIEPPEEATAVTTHGQEIYIAMRIIRGCGSACDTQQMLASANRFEIPMHYEEPPGLSKPTPAASRLTLLKSQDDLYHVTLVDDRQVQLFTLTESAEWDGVCKVDLEPRGMHSLDDSELRAAMQSIADLQTTIQAVRQDAGICGTLNIHARRGQWMGEAFHQALFRPWAFPAAKSEPGVSWTEWSLLGIDEYAAVAKFRAQLPVTIGQLSRLYERRFRWSRTEAAQAARDAVAGALDSGFAFSSAPLLTDGSAPLRQAILNNRPVAELETLQWQPTKPEWPSWVSSESPLNVAVKHADALRWLLSKKLDPNQANDFGKTPLMYAAQHNALAAVRILLDHGADPNAATIFPEDTCTYKLERANVTALHYAVRFGSADIVTALLDGGALPFVKTNPRDSRQTGQTAQDWLGMYASPNIADADLPRLTQLLAAPEPGKLSEYAERQTLQAEQQYAAGKLDAARRSLKNALQASPSHARALSDMSLVALRAGQYGESIEAAMGLVAGSADSRLLANAWFNIGLACEGYGRSYLSYNGETYCMSSAIFPFLRSWQAANSRARAEKLEQLLRAPGTERCALSQPDSTEHHYVFVRAADMDDNRYAQIQRIYVLHPTASTIPAEQIGWNVTPYAGNVRTPRPVTPRRVTSHPLGRSTLTVFESEDGVQPPVTIGGRKCF